MRARIFAMTIMIYDNAIATLYRMQDSELTALLRDMLQQPIITLRSMNSHF